MYQPKVSTIRKYSDEQGSHVVHEGKLILLKNKKPPADVYVKGKYGKHPIIISETEEIEVGDYFIVTNKHNSQYGEIIKCVKSNDEYINEESFDDLGWHKTNIAKILALPEHFSDKHLQAIVDGKMKDSDSVYITCEDRVSKPEGEYFVRLNLQNHITLFPAKQFLEEVAVKYANDIYPEHRMLTSFGACKRGFIAGAEWAKNN